MKKTRYLLSIQNIVVAFFLLSSIVCSHFSSYVSEHIPNPVVVTKKSTSSSSAFTQLFCEQKEKEEENGTTHNTHNPAVVCYLIAEYLHLSDNDIRPSYGYEAPPACGNATDVPLYLSKRTFLI